MPDRSGLYWQERFDEALLVVSTTDTFGGLQVLTTAVFPVPPRQLGLGWYWGNLYSNDLRRVTHTLEFSDA